MTNRRYGFEDESTDETRPASRRRGGDKPDWPRDDRSGFDRLRAKPSRRDLDDEILDDDLDELAEYLESEDLDDLDDDLDDDFDGYDDEFDPDED